MPGSAALAGALADTDGTDKAILNQPPRSLKSFIVSVCLPAWLLGRNPTHRIICASYAEDLANKFSRDCRALMDSPFYKRVGRRIIRLLVRSIICDFANPGQLIAEH